MKQFIFNKLKHKSIIFLIMSWIIAEYIWIDAYNKLRSKTKVIQMDNSFKYHGVEFIKNFHFWNYD